MLLPWLILIPFIGGFLCWQTERFGVKVPRWIALVTMGLTLALSLQLWLQGGYSLTQSAGIPQWQSEFDMPWIPRFGISIHLAIDGLSLLMVVLTGLLGVLAVLCSWKEIEKYQGFFHLNLMWILGGVIGVFLAIDMFLFFFFWEMMLVPMYFLIALWGHKASDGKTRITAATKFFIYTQASGLVMLIAIQALVFVHYNATGVWTFNYEELLNTPMSNGVEYLLMLGFFIAFAVKMPVVPLHGWLPAAMIAPTPVSALLHAVAVVKTGVFAVLRIIGFVFGPKLLADIGTADILAWFAAGSIIISSLIAIQQDNLKRRLAFSTIGQLSYIVLGAALLSPLSIKGAYLHLVAHAVMKITLFMCAGVIIVRTHRSNISEMYGIGKKMPITMCCFTIASLGIAGMPFLVGFISKWNLALGALQSGKPLYVAVLIASAMLALTYLMPVCQMAYFKRDPQEQFRTYGEISYRMLLPICFTTILALVLGVMPEISPNFYAMASQAADSICQGWTGGGW